MSKLKKIFLVFLLVAFSALLFNSFCSAQGRELEIKYPELGVHGVETPTKTKTALPEYLRYIFTFAIIIAGLAVFGALIYGGVCYLTSAGDPTKMADAKNQVIAGFSGLIILLSSYLILNTINPQLVLPERPPIAPAKAGIRIYAMAGCQEDQEHPSEKVAGDIKKLKDPEAFLDWGTDGAYKIQSLKFLGNPEVLTVQIYESVDFGEPVHFIDYLEGTDNCKNTDNTGNDLGALTQRSIKLDWHPSGVYLYASDDCTGDDFKVYQSSSATLPEFNDRTQSIKFVYGDKDPDLGKYQLRYAAILHEKENYMGEAALFDFDPAGDNCKKLSEGGAGADLTNKVSSITVYLKPKFIKTGEEIIEQITGGGVRFWGDKNYTKEKDKIALPSETGYYGDNDQRTDLGDADNKITSMEMDGNYVALLFRNEDYGGDCEVFMSSCPDFRSRRIGQCGWLGRSDCLSSFIVKARK